MITEGSHYLIDETEYAYCVETNKKNVSKEVLLNLFKKNCTSDNVKRAFCQVDRDSDEMVKHGMTTFGVETKDQVLITIGVHENNYGSCKEEMMELQNCVKRAEAKIVDKKDTVMMKIKKAAIAAAVVAGGFALVRGFNANKTKFEPTEQPTIEQPTEEQNVSYEDINKIQVLPNLQNAVETQVAESEQNPMVFHGEEDKQQDVKENKQQYPYTDSPTYTQMYEGIDINTPEGVKQANETDMKITELKSEAYINAVREDLQNSTVINPYPNPMPEGAKTMN